MGITSNFCPHCKTENTGFSPVHAALIASVGISIAPRWIVMFQCLKCLLPCVALVEDVGNGGRANPMQTAGDPFGAGFHLLKWWPETLVDVVPGDVPETIARAFLSALANMRPGHFDAAGIMFRKVIELATKQRAPDFASMNLNKRIEKMAEQHIITAEMAEWAHIIRDDGNEAVHTDAEFTEADAQDLEAFCRPLLMYLYTLPAMVARRRTVAT